LIHSTTTSLTTDGKPDVPAQVFETFLQVLAGSGVSAELIARLRTTLLEEQTFTERALKVAVLGEEPLP
jgi:hypothetical protein